MSENSFEVVNVVGTGRLPTELAISALKEDLSGIVSENDTPQPGLHLKFVEDGPLATFYRSGKYIIRAPSKSKLQQMNNDLKSEIGRLKLMNPQYNTDFQIKNVVAVGKLDIEHIDLPTLVIGLGLEYSEYEPEQFPALTYRNSKYPCTFLIFANGKVVMAGGKSVTKTREAYTEFITTELDLWLDFDN
jgi:transcription initiation factor TFIID TATA-box-binding protein